MTLNFRKSLQTCILLWLGLSHGQSSAQVVPDPELAPLYRSMDCPGLLQTRSGLDDWMRSLDPQPTGVARLDRNLHEVLAEWEQRKLAIRAALAEAISSKQCDKPQAAAPSAALSGRANPAQLSVAPTAAGLLPQIGARVDVLSTGFAQSLGLTQARGALVLEVEAGGSADKAGLRALDVIVEITGQGVQDPDDLRESLSRMRPGFRAPLRVWRNKAMRDVVLEIGQASAGGAATATARVASAGFAPDPQADVALQGKAQAGDVPSMLRLAMQLELAPVSRPQAAAWYRKAADAGSPEGMGGVGASYFNAVDGSKDELLAQQWWRKGAAAGDGRSMAGLSILYAEGKGGLPKDMQLAREWLLKAAATGDGRAMSRLSSQYATGGSGLARDDAQALAWMEKAVATGEPLIMAAMAEMYESGRGGLPQNDMLALAWAQKAAALGEPRSMNRIGFFYANGRAGLPKNATQALTWYQRAAALGDEPGMLNMGNYYLQGLVVPQSDVAALAWFRKAAAMGNKQAEQNILQLEARGVR